MKKLLLLAFFAPFAATSLAQTVSFSITTAPCNHDGVLATSFSGVTPPLTVSYITEGTQGTTIVHTSVSGLSDVLTGYSGGPIEAIATDAIGDTVGGRYSGMPPFSYDVLESSAICPGLGRDSALVTGGTAPYTYQWFNQITTAVMGASNPISLPPGTYGVEITDARGCEFGSWDQPDSAGIIYSISSDTVSVTTTTASCTNGSATAAPGGGVAPYTYLWSNGATSPAITGLTMGDYMLTVTDADGCTASAYGYVLQSIVISAHVTTTPATCIATDGAVIAFGSGGMPPYSYVWSNGATTASQTGLAGGFLSVNVTDANGCIGTGSSYVSTSTPITVTYSTTPTLCTSPTGTATLHPAGGTAPYTFLWYTAPPQTSITATALAQGNYPFQVTDAAGCIQTGTVIVPPIDLITGTFSSVAAVCTLSNGSMSVYPTGGVAPYSYLWSSGATTESIYSKPSGLYHVTITDALGCRAKISEILPDSNDLAVGITSTPASCVFVDDGVASAFGIGGTPPYSYGWTSGGTTGTITGLPYGPYWVWVTDALGCSVPDYTYVGYDTASFCYCTLEGTVYHDVIGDCLISPVDAGIPDVQIKLSGSSYPYSIDSVYTYTNGSGYYSYKVPSGSYTVSQTVLAFYPLSACQLNNIPVTVVAGTGCVHTVNFGDAMDSIHDMHICTWDYTLPVPGSPYTQMVIMNNRGTVDEPAVFADYHPDGQLLPPTFVPGGTFSGTPYWYTTSATPDAINAGASQSFLINYNVPTDIPLGTNVLFTDTVAYAAPVSNWLLDYSPWNNLNYFTTTVVAAFDPNFKEVYPTGTGATGIISYTDSILQYMVHFQNTGTAPAENIIVKDTLDNNLNWSTLTPVFMSAQGQVTLDQEGAYKVVTFTFNDINLPTASSNSVTSNGMFTYSVHTKSGLPVGTQFKNQASIYFDYNAPVMTNQTLNTLGTAAPSSVTKLSLQDQNSFTVYPNPASGTFNALINSDATGSAIMTVSDVTGKTLLSKNIGLQAGPQTISTDVSKFAPGVYFVSLVQNGKTQTQKLVIMN